MLKGSNTERLEQEIAHLISFISEGRELFFKKTGNSLASNDEYVNHLKTIELFQEDKALIQLDLNIQLLYIKLSSYYDGMSKKWSRDVRVPRNIFAHKLTDLVFNKKVKYNFFIYRVSNNFKKVKYLFYSEQLVVADNSTTKVIELNLHKDINDFLEVWKNKSQESSSK